MKAGDEITRALVSLNRRLEREDCVVLAYRVRRDDDIDGDVADVLFRLPPPEDDRAWPLEYLDALCTRAFETLAEWVEFTFCTFHTEEEAATVLGSPGHSGWTPLDNERVAA